jgi:adenylate cyclase
LRCLVENVGRLVTKDELIKAVWPNVVVTDESLARCISEVRQAIADSDQTIIKTVPRRGYRFSSPVSQHPENADTANVVAAPPAGTKASIEPRISDQASIAVLPFANLSGDPQQEYFSDGITEDIITELSRFSELAVKTFQYKGKTLDVREVERQLGVRYVLEGSIRRAGDRIRINAKLIDAASGAHRWAERYDREVSDVFAVQDEVTRAIVTVLSGYLNMAEAERTLLKPPASHGKHRNRVTTWSYTSTDLPDGQISNLPVQPPLQKYFAFGVGQIKSTTRAVLSHRGALRNVTNAGRDAVDADALSDEGR